MSCNDHLNALFDRVRVLEASPQNIALQQRWNLSGDELAYLVTPTYAGWAPILGHSLVSYFTDPEAYLEDCLRAKLFAFEHWHDVPLLKHIPIQQPHLEPSLFGQERMLSEDSDPWLSQPVLASPEDVDRITPIDFHRSGLMPLVHRFHNQLRELAPDDFTVDFPDWARSPWGVAWQILGYENLMIAVATDIGGVVQLLRFLTDARKHWYEERARHLGLPLGPAPLANDEVHVPTISPHLYRQVIYPFEEELARFHGGITEYHSCGNLTPMLADIAGLPGLRVGYAGPWTDLEAAVRAFGGAHKLQVALDVVNDVLLASEEAMACKVRHIIRTCRGTRFFIRVGPVDRLHGRERDLAQLSRWISVARRVAAEEGLQVPESIGSENP